MRFVIAREREREREREIERDRGSERERERERTWKNTQVFKSNLNMKLSDSDRFLFQVRFEKCRFSAPEVFGARPGLKFCRVPVRRRPSMTSL